MSSSQPSGALRSLIDHPFNEGAEPGQAHTGGVRLFFHMLPGTLAQGMWTHCIVSPTGHGHKSGAEMSKADTWGQTDAAALLLQDPPIPTSCPNSCAEKISVDEAAEV